MASLNVLVNEEVIYLISLMSLTRQEVFKLYQLH